GQSVEWIVVGDAAGSVGQVLDRVLEIGPGVARVIGGQFAVELGQSSGVAEVDHRRGDFLEAGTLADQPGKERHAAAGAVRVLVAVVGPVYEVLHAVGYPRRRRGKIGESIIADHRRTPSR